ncbi:MAG: hypothetical protein DWQ47_11010 [Acidobacteria bacterium]|nr:MAG: hypothetical protein DWQ32_13425 [Acidobacteriota bacterium]REJ98108.1 MAG: hypothetical protein DWQ38_16225 [Acidobacteriota bacterium]REK16851.1 MAG: hypothetical protein DWQ43_01270 [Acidobacteriota bacterium]REK42762.1 MAG: hypothetical protein DWQ47_11010 [Acidobacteriota bacterium]
MESLDNLTDKTKRFLFEVESEEEALSKKRQELSDEKARRDALLQRNSQLQAVIKDLESRRDVFDQKVTTLIDALGEIPLREIS